MKKIIIPVALIVLVWSCSKKMTPSNTQVPNSSSSAPIIVDKPATDNNTTTATNPNTGAVPGKDSPQYGQKSVERTGAGNDPAAIAGMAIYNEKCHSCHGLKVTTDYTVARWYSIMAVMAMKAHLTDTERDNVLAYVKANAKP